MAVQKVRNIAEMTAPPRPNSHWHGEVTREDTHKSRATSAACGMAQNLRRVNHRIGDPLVGSPELSFLFHAKNENYRVRCALDMAALLGEAQHDEAKKTAKEPKPFYYKFIVISCKPVRVNGPNRRTTDPRYKEKKAAGEIPSRKAVASACRRRFRALKRRFE